MLSFFFSLTVYRLLCYISLLVRVSTSLYLIQCSARRNAHFCTPTHQPSRLFLDRSVRNLRGPLSWDNVSGPSKFYVFLYIYHQYFKHIMQHKLYLETALICEGKKPLIQIHIGAVFTHDNILSLILSNHIHTVFHGSIIIRDFTVQL